MLIDPSRTAAVRRVLDALVDGRGRRPRPWATAPLATADVVLELCGGMGAADPPRWSHADVDGPIPLADNSVDGVCLSLVLALVDDVDSLFAELRRVLRPGGTLVALVPSVLVRSVPEIRMAPLLRTVWPRPRPPGLDHAGWLLAAADFAVLGDDRVSFAHPAPDAGAVADLCAAGVWAPTIDAARRDDVVSRIPSGRALPVPLRRVVARR